jgi:hypothetical protein
LRTVLKTEALSINTALTLTAGCLVKGTVSRSRWLATAARLTVSYTVIRPISFITAHWEVSRTITATSLTAFTGAVSVIGLSTILTDINQAVGVGIVIGHRCTLRTCVHVIHQVFLESPAINHVLVFKLTRFIELLRAEGVDTFPDAITIIILKWVTICTPATERTGDIHRSKLLRAFTVHINAEPYFAWR